MKIQADEEGKRAIKELCSIALRFTAPDMHLFVAEVLSALKELEELEKDKDPDDNGKDKIPEKD